MTRKNLYYLVLFLGLAGQIWIFYSYTKLERQEDSFNICLFKRVTGLPCPSCGTIHSIVSILHGDFRKALWENPLGFPDLLIVAILPFWILADLVFGKESFYRIYLRTVEVLKMKGVLFAVLSVIFIIWLYKLAQALLWI
jgi:hypothetical protein